MKAWGRFVVVAAGAVLLASVLVAPALATAPATGRAHRRHVEVREPSSRAFISLGDHDGYEVVLSLEEPDLAVLAVERFDPKTQEFAVTRYGAHFRGSLPSGRLRARFGSLGTVSLRFHPGRERRPEKLEGNCAGRHARVERGYFVGRISLRGEGGYFRLTAHRVGGEMWRRFRLRCRVKHPRHAYPPPSLREAVDSRLGEIGAGDTAGSLATLGAEFKEHGRLVETVALRLIGASTAEVAAVVLEDRDGMPVERGAEVPEAPPGTFLTTLPGEHPASATLKPPAPFSGEAEYSAASSTSHSFMGTLAVQFPGLLQPLAGPNVFSTFCVISPLRVRYGCDSVPPDWQVGGPSTTAQWGLG